MSTMFNAYDLHLPHKTWANDPKEKQNYEVIEQWAKRLRGCYPPASGPPSTDLANYQQHFYGNAPITYAGSTTPYPQTQVDWRPLVAVGDSSPAFTALADHTLQVKANGLFLWQGQVIGDVHGSATLAETRFKGNFSHLETYDRKPITPNGVPGLIGSPGYISELGGVHYVHWDPVATLYETLELHLTVWGPAGGTSTALIDVTLTLITEAPI